MVADKYLNGAPVDTDLLLQRSNSNAEFEIHPCHGRLCLQKKVFNAFGWRIMPSAPTEVVNED
jgi:hypothetical protein